LHFPAGLSDATIRNAVSIKDSIANANAYAPSYPPEGEVSYSIVTPSGSPTKYIQLDAARHRIIDGQIVNYITRFNVQIKMSRDINLNLLKITGGNGFMSLDSRMFVAPNLTTLEISATNLTPHRCFANNASDIYVPMLTDLKYLCANASETSTLPLQNFQIPETATNCSHLFENNKHYIDISKLRLPSTVTDMSFFGQGANLRGDISNFFPESRPSNSHVLNLDYAFYGQRYLTGTVPAWLTSEDYPNHTHCFYNCPNLENVPDDWK
jgi:hypothetical protein